MATITSNLLLDLIGVFVALLAVVYTFFKCSFSYWKKRNVPVPVEPSIPFGNLENPIWRKKTFGENIEDIYFELRRRKLRYGGTYVFSAPELLVADPEIVRCVLAKDFHHFVDRGLYHDEKANPLTGHLFLLEGAKWKNLRAKLTPTFTSGKMKMMFNTLVECSGPMIRSVEKQAVEQTPIDIKEVLGCFTTDIIGSCAFGLECKSFEGEEAEFRTHGRKLFTPTPLIVLQNAIAISLPRFAKALRLSLMPKDEIDFFLNIVRDNIQYRERNNFRRNDFFQLLMDIKKKSEEDGGKPFTVEEFAAQVFLFFVAGFETSSTTMTFAFYELSRHPDIQKKVRQEVNEVLKRHDGQITYEAIQDMKLLRCVIDESLRMYSPVSLLFRKCISDYKVPNSDVVIEKGVKVAISVYGLHKDPEYFPEPEKFKPERFSDENKANIKPFTYLPFGDGPRNCIGLRFGIMQSMVGMAILLKNFEFTLNSKTKSPLKLDPKIFITAAEGGIWLNATRIGGEPRSVA